MWYRRRGERESEEVPCWCEENALRVFAMCVRAWSYGARFSFCYWVWWTTMGGGRTIEDDVCEKK